VGGRGTYQIARIFGIRIGASASWFLVLFFYIYYLSSSFHNELGGSQSTAYAVAVGSALAFFGSLILHELGHALIARRLGYEIDGIDLWFFGGLSRMREETRTPGDEFKIAIAGPLVTLAVAVLCVAIGIAASSGSRFLDAALLRGNTTPSPGLALLGWLGFINAVLLVFNLIPAFPLDGGRIARAAVWARTGDQNRGTRVTGRVGQVFAVALGLYGLFSLAAGGAGLLLVVLAFFLYQSAGAAVAQGSFGLRIADVTVADIMDREPVTIAGDTSLLDAEEQFFLRYRWPWFAVVDPQRHFLGVVRADRVGAEIQSGRPALAVTDVLDEDGQALRIGEDQPLEALLRSDGLRRLGAMVAVDGEGVLRGVVTLAQVRRALSPSPGA
jgi:Zn-dependent protease